MKRQNKKEFRNKKLTRGKDRGRRRRRRRRRGRGVHCWLKGEPTAEGGEEEQLVIETLTQFL